jgi:hypothetical protein
MRLPDFLVIGAAKSGTISLYHYISQHPEIFMCPVKECNFFALEKADWNAEYQGPVDRLWVDQHCIKTIEGYRELFRGAASGQVIGESSPLYLFSKAAAVRIHRHIPRVKLIAILRHPVDRAFSNFQHLRRSGIEPIADFSEAIRSESVRHAEGWGPWPFWYYTEMGFFAKQLQTYLDLFGRQQLLVRLYDDLRADAGRVVKDIYEFVGVSNFRADVSTRHNLGGRPRRNWLQRIIVKPNPAKILLKAVVPATVRHRVRDGIADWNTEKPRLDPHVRSELTQMYREDILKLQELIDRDLSHWL